MIKRIIAIQKRFAFTLVIFLLAYNVIYAQSEIRFKWWNPAQHEFHVIEGQALPGQTKDPYGRLPEKIKKDVREVVWEKSQQPTGLVVRFQTDASIIQVRYQVENKLEFEHMPATGVSGLDLYSLEKDNTWKWTGGNYLFGDTILYYFHSSDVKKRDYYLYLPLYNKLKWLEIGIPEDAGLKPIPIREKQQIVIYGTSIVQGGCASRPGMTWPAQLGRRLQSPIINLGFSSNGLLEEPLIKLMTEIDAKIFILDCLPNLMHSGDDVIKARITDAVRNLQLKKPDIPILLTENTSANIGLLDTNLDAGFQRVNKLMQETFAKLKSEGIENIYLLSGENIGLNNESTVDGQHPNDVGMELYASAYQKIIQKILNKDDSGSQSETLVNSCWLGFQRQDFKLNGRNCILIKPENPAKGNPWIWRTEFFGHEPQADSVLVSKGFHVAYIDVTDMYGSPDAMNIMDTLYEYLTNLRKLNKKSVLEGFSRGGLFALNWAARHPERVSCIYLDAPVCDFKSWPGGMGKSKKSAADWEKLKEAYKFKNDKQAFSYTLNPVDNLSPLAKYKIPIISVCGCKDILVPLEENTGLLEKRYKDLGGEIQTIYKPDAGHHPHSLKDPTPIVSFILKSANGLREEGY